ncbi:MAG TPA: Crp/Fnr family transcriptional regulator [Gemmataceae bacterium]|nr:Crp/Fnr family transcriptional regulator [Gemmataceae bacterium]
MPKANAGAAAPANHILASLPRREYARLRPHLTVVDLRQGETLYEPGGPMTFVYFPENGMVSVVAPMGEDDIAEAGVITRRGMVGLPIFLGQTRSNFRVLVQIPCTARRMEVAAFRAALKQTRALNDRLREYLHAFLTHVSQSAACNCHHTVEQRCCRWLLVAHDLTGEPILALTHEFLAAMLGVRRTGVTEVAGKLQRAGLIRYRRGVVEILDRSRLEATSCPCFRVIRAAFNGRPPAGRRNGEGAHAGR